MSTLINHIRKETVTDRWLNGKVGKFEYIASDNAYRFRATTENATNFLVVGENINEENTPIVIKGFLANLIRTFGHYQSEKDIYIDFYETNRERYRLTEGQKPGSFKRDIDAEFHALHLEYCVKFYNESKAVFEYLPQMDIDLLTNFFDAYLEYVHSTYINTKNRSSKHEEIVLKSLKDLFEGEIWEVYLDRLTECKPQLLTKGEYKYKFVGNPKTQVGVVAAYFKYLKTKGILKQNLNRNSISEVLNDEIVNFKVSGSTIDNISNTYDKKFKKQLEFE